MELTVADVSKELGVSEDTIDVGIKKDL